MGVEYLVSYAPANNRGVIPVAPYPGSHVLFYPLVKETRIVVVGLAALPHVEALGEDQHSEFVGKFHEFLRGHVVGSSYRVNSHLS